MEEYPANFRKLQNILQGLGVWSEFEYEYCRQRGIRKITPNHVANITASYTPLGIMRDASKSFTWSDSRLGWQFWMDIRQQIKE